MKGACAVKPVVGRDREALEGRIPEHESVGIVGSTEGYTCEGLAFEGGSVSTATVLRTVVVAKGAKREEDMIVWWGAVVEVVWCCEIRWVFAESYRNEVYTSNGFTDGPKPEGFREVCLGEE